MVSVAEYHLGLTTVLGCVFILATTRRLQPLLLLAVAASTTSILTFAKLTTGEMIKTLALLPLGLGSVLIFTVMTPHAIQRSILPNFTAYINFAVIGNVLMMIFTPADGTFRAHGCHFCCLCLVTSLLSQTRSHRFATVEIDVNDNDLNHKPQRYFLFTSVSSEWVLMHAVYRSVLITLPCFDTWRHAMMEPFSLTFTTLLWMRHGGGRPWCHFFGYADTLVVPTMAAFTALVGDGVEGGGVGGWRISSGGSLDLVMGAAMVGLGVLALRSAFVANQR